MSPAPLLAVLDTLAAQIKALAAQITEQPGLHADAQVFTSLPRSGTVRAARLLAETGDCCRARFPDPQSLMRLAGVAPSTRQSGKVKAVSFRWAAGKQPRDAVCDFAAGSRHASLWAAQLYQRRHRSWQRSSPRHPFVARAWLYVIWHCRQDRTAYDPALRKALQRLLRG